MARAVGPYLPGTTPAAAGVEGPLMVECAYCGGQVEKWGDDSRHVDHYNEKTGALLDSDIYHVACQELAGAKPKPRRRREQIKVTSEDGAESFVDDDVDYRRGLR